MTINWPLIAALFCISIPGVLIAIHRLVYFLLPDNSDALKKRIARFAILQTLIMVFILSFAGTIVSKNTGLHATILEELITGKASISDLARIIPPAFAYSLLTLIIFTMLYYAMRRNWLDKKSAEVMAKMKQKLGLDGCLLYGGIVEEIAGRWGLMNLAVFFAVLFTKQTSPSLMWIAIILSGLIFAVGQLPAYIAAGCTSSRKFIYSYILLNLSQSIIFGYVFWQYGLVCAILTHILFHLEWAFFEKMLARSRVSSSAT